MSKSIVSKYRAEIRSADKLYSTAAALIPKRDLFLYRIPGLGNREKALAGAILCKLCREYRAAYLLGQEGYVAEGELVVRAMFEGVVTLRFLLLPRIRLVSNGVPVVTTGRKPLTRRVRADMYMYHDMSETARRIREYRRTPGLKRLGRSLDLTEHDAGQQEFRKGIGEAWASLIDKTRRLAGLPLKDLAATVGLAQAYPTAYSYLSKGAHAKEPLRFIRDVSRHMGLEVKLTPDPHGIERLFGVADSLMYDAAFLFNKELRRGKGHELRDLFALLRLRERARGV